MKMGKSMTARYNPVTRTGSMVSITGPDKLLDRPLPHLITTEYITCFWAILAVVPIPQGAARRWFV